jgi:hypothetical protein
LFDRTRVYTTNAPAADPLEGVRAADVFVCDAYCIENVICIIKASPGNGRGKPAYGARENIFSRWWRSSMSVGAPVQRLSL